LGQCFRTISRSKHIKDRYSIINYFHKAEKYLCQAILLAKEIGFIDLERVAQTTLGDIYSLDINDNSLGQKCYERAIELLELTRGMLIEESHRIGYFGQARDTYIGLAMLFMSKEDLIEAYMIIEKARLRTLIEQLTYTIINPTSTIPSSLLREEEQWNSELRHLSLALRHATDKEASVIADKLELVQKSRDAVLERMDRYAMDYVALRCGFVADFYEIKKILNNVL
jgi:tetratricopeptide (TPR) repeat protein